jgi:hypothetical protein
MRALFLTACLFSLVLASVQITLAAESQVCAEACVQTYHGAHGGEWKDCTSRGCAAGATCDASAVGVWTSEPRSQDDHALGNAVLFVASSDCASDSGSHNRTLNVGLLIRTGEVWWGSPTEPGHDYQGCTMGAQVANGSEDVDKQLAPLGLQTPRPFVAVPCASEPPFLPLP